MRLNPQAVWEHLSRRDMTQNELARAAGISPGHISFLMNGKRSPSPGVRRRLRAALGVTDFDELFILESPRE
ncbi:MAG: helix-turn-helix transcriptional regulator [Dehalococcoidia bacterium]|nr:helix-turn-helix transcriptional regulator [Dehalococcoidia bacterium]